MFLTNYVPDSVMINQLGLRKNMVLKLKAAAKPEALPSSILVIISALVYSIIIYNFFAVLIQSQSATITSSSHLCSPFTCGNITFSNLPFGSGQVNCGLPGYQVTCSDDPSSPPSLFLFGRLFQLKSVNDGPSDRFITVVDTQLISDLNSASCASVRNLTTSNSPSSIPSLSLPPWTSNLTLFNCPAELTLDRELFREIVRNYSCEGEGRKVYLWQSESQFGPPVTPQTPDGCDLVMVPVLSVTSGSLNWKDEKNLELVHVLADGFPLTWPSFQECYSCRNTSGRCGLDAGSRKIVCFCDHCNRHQKSEIQELIIGIATGSCGILLLLAVLLLIKKKYQLFTSKDHGTDLHESLDHSEDTFKPGCKDTFRMNQSELEAEIRMISRDSTLDPRRKSYLIQNLLTRSWIASQQKSLKSSECSNSEELLGRYPSFRDPEKQVFGCEHYKRNCKVLAGCCGKLFSCRFCHDKVSDHSMDRMVTSEMMCMQCLKIQPIGPACTTPSCCEFSMAKYYCNLCKLFDDERAVYHCPFCNLCRLGTGLGVDYFHCMKCNCCMSMDLVDHKCQENCLETNCPICSDFMFTSSAPLKALPCGHIMHSTCFEAYICNDYICPICSKSAGDMSVYFGMLDELLASEVLPEEYRNRCEDILCNDCDKKGVAPFHLLYHKCASCGSYNTGVIKADSTDLSCLS